jgi:signal recognition particle receptor subunit beta
MAIVNHAKKEINAKIVYYGPGLSGKTTNIKFIHEKMKPEFRGAFKFLNTRSGKMFFFDFMRPEQIGIKDYNIRFHIYTVPGEVHDYVIWKTVLKGMDGMVFVADSVPDKLSSNQESMKNLAEYLGTLGTDLRDIPCIFQCNKQDIPGALTLEDLRANLTVEDFRMIPAVAQKGEGVLNTLSNIVKMVMQKLREIELEIAEESSVVEATQPVFSSRSDTPNDVQIQPATCSFEEEIVSETTLDAAGFHGFTSITSTQLTAEEIEPSTEKPECAEITSAIEFTGDVEQIAPGSFRLPISLKYGEIEKRIALTVAFAIENPGNKSMF